MKLLESMCPCAYNVLPSHLAHLYIEAFLDAYFFFLQKKKSKNYSYIGILERS